MRVRLYFYAPARMRVIVRVIINGLGHMGMPGLLAIQQITESLRFRQIELSVAGLIDVDETLREKVHFFTRHLSPGPILAFQDPEHIEDLDSFIRKNDLLIESGESYLVYDASPNHFHFMNLQSCISLPRVTYLVEKPIVSLQKELDELKSMAASRATSTHPMTNRLYCDFIETQSAVCLHLQDMVCTGDLVIDELNFYRLNSSGTAKAYRPGERVGVQGGSLLDKSIHDLSITAALLAPNNPMSLVSDLKWAIPLCFLPCRNGTFQGLLNGYNAAWSEDKKIGDWPADGASVFNVVWQAGTRSIPATYSASWVGAIPFDDLCKEHSNGLRGITQLVEDYKGCPSWLYSVRTAQNYIEQDARLLEIKGKLKGKSMSLLVNFLARGKEISPWIWNSKAKAIIDIPTRPYGTNSLARVLELGVLAATGLPVNCIGFDLAVLCHQELLRAHSKLLERDIKPVLENKIGTKIVGKPIALDYED